MSLRDILGLIFCAIGVTVGTIGYRLLGLEWYFGAFGIISIGLLFIWSAVRDRKLQKALDEVSGDWGDRHYSSGASATDNLDFSGAEDD